MVSINVCDRYQVPRGLNMVSNSFAEAEKEQSSEEEEEDEEPHFTIQREQHS